MFNTRCELWLYTTCVSLALYAAMLSWNWADCAAPWLTKLAYAVIQGKLEQNQDQLAREAVDNLEKLGPTFIKLGQILSIRYGARARSLPHA